MGSKMIAKNKIARKGNLQLDMSVTIFDDSDEKRTQEMAPRALEPWVQAEGAVIKILI